MTKKIVLAAVGSLGDVHPFIAIGLALQERGAAPILAVPANHAPKVEAAGLRAHVTMDAFETMPAQLGLSEGEFIHRVMTNTDFLIRNYVLRTLSQCTRAIDAVAADAHMIVGSLLCLGAEIVAEKRGIPFAPGMLQPLAFQSTRDPPQTPDYAMMRRYPAVGIGLSWNRMWRSLIFDELKRRYQKPINNVRVEHGLTPLRHAPIFASEIPPRLRLALYPDLLGPDDPAVTAGAVFTGFPTFDSSSGAPEKLDDEAEAFLASGEAPLIFTLGSVAAYAPGAFYHTSVEAARALGRRAILLGGPEGLKADDILVRQYLPHSQVFSRGAVIVHQGGIGTIGQAMRAGRPQIVVPHWGDQGDNAARIERLSIGITVPPRRYKTGEVARVLARALGDAAMAGRASALGLKVREEAGAAAAADAILSALNAG